MEYQRMLYEEVEPDIVKIMMNRPEIRNAQDPLMFAEMADAFIRADLDEDVRVIIFGGTGKDFSAGHDMSGTGQPAPDDTIIGRALKTKLTGTEMRIKRETYIFWRQCMDIRNVSKPTIAMVQGTCAAGGWMNAAVCDLIVCSEDARFINPVVRMTPAGGEILMEAFDLGFRRAKHHLWTGEPITAQEGYRLGFVCKVVPREKLEEETLALARQIALNQPVSVSLVKKSINMAQEFAGLRNAWEYHFLIHELSHSSDEARRWSEQRLAAMTKGGVQEFLKLRDGKFKDAGVKY